ncbi:hypothetical protein [Hymenobacter sp. B81]|uniref:hypothetical protein n=1 Tax=Hymenobacter sp. B81 TaxID=3344878 RepID=UPI0037DCE262
MFYRLARFFFRKDGSSASRAIVTVSLVQSFCLNFLLRVIIGVTDSDFISETPFRKFTNLALFLSFVVLALNYVRYHSRYSALSDRWRNAETPVQKRVRGTLVVAAIIFSFLIQFVIIS